LKAIFFDSNATLLAKNLLPIAHHISENESDFLAVFISAEIASNVDPEIEEKSIANITDNINYQYIRFKSFNINAIVSILKEINPDFVFIDCYRVIDQLWLGISNRLGIKTYYMQHGFEINSVYYKPFSIITKFGKGIRLLEALYNLSKLLDVGAYPLFKQYMRYIYYGDSLKSTYLGNHNLHPQLSFVYSEYYKQFWNDKYDFDVKKMEVITPPDLLLIDQVKSASKENALCYITQTLVEDGRMKKRTFLKLMEEYKGLIKSLDKFIIKLHPRSNVSLYNTFVGLENVQIVREFPHTTSYLTHYSSMAFLAAFLSNTVILHELEGHPTPSIFKHVSNYIVNDTNDINSVVKDVNVGEKRKRGINYDEIKYYSFVEDINPFEKIYKTISFDLGR
jgi:hypothetical protein